MTPEEQERFNYMTVKLMTGDLQLEYNALVDLQVLIDGDGEEYKVYYIQGGKIVKYLTIGFHSNIPYYSAKDIAQQGSNLPQDLLL